MAGEWIKMEHTLPEKPEVMRMARILGIDPDAVVGKLVRFWGWVDGVSVDGVVDGVVDADIDSICRCSGFASACVAVGWLVMDNVAERATLPNFDNHNGETAKKRGLKNKRQAKWRKGVDGAVDVAASTVASTREEKRREEKKEQEQGAIAPAAPKSAKRPKRQEQTFTEWADTLDGEAIPLTDPVFAASEKSGLPADFVSLAWGWFEGEYGAGGFREAKRYADWRAVFRKAVAGNWGRLWAVNRQGEFYLTTEGVQAQRALA